MVDLDAQMKIEKLMDYAYDKTMERIAAIEDASDSMVYRSIVVEKGNIKSYFQSYIHYYLGMFEGILFTFFLEDFDRMPTPSENAFISDSMGGKWTKIIDTVKDVVSKKFKEDSRIV